VFLQQIVEMIIGWIHRAGFDRVRDPGRQLLDASAPNFPRSVVEEADQTSWHMDYPDPID
jgi:hypothetical protein